VTPHPDSVGIVGAGRFGTALANLIASAGRPVIIWSREAGVVDAIVRERINPRLPEVRLSPALAVTGDPGELGARARLIVVAVSSADVRARVRELGEHIEGNHVVVHAIGALATPGDVRVSQVILEETGALRIGALAGPALTRDLVSEQFASMVVASRFAEVRDEVRRLVSVPPALRIYGGSDVIGVELAAALAGAYTIAVALCDALGMGPGPRAVLITRALAEAARLGEAAGAEARTFTGLAGLGNLLVRTQSEHARDYVYGLSLARVRESGADAGLMSEGARAALAGVRLAQRLGVRVPVLSGVAAVIAGELLPAQAAAALADTVAAEE
jgi:glycerol-3-phosphate dehydrogenase (NAD(P)+)